jgi:hypothetical protein
MADPTNPPSIQSEAVQLMGQIPFGAILGAPLVAAVGAQAAAAQACVDFITKVGLDGNTVRTARFDFVRSVPTDDAEASARKALGFPDGALSDDQQKQLADKIAAIGPMADTRVSVTVPLLSLMPIPFIRIDNLTIAMKTSITATTESSGTNTTSNALEGKADGSVGWGPLKVGFSGSVSSKKDSTATSTSKYSVEQTIDVNIHATQDDVPAGLAKVLNILTENIRTVAQG